VAEYDKRMACAIKADSTTARDHKIDNCEFDGTNTICWQLPLQGAVKTNFSVTLDEPVLPGLTTVDPTEMQGPYFRREREACSAIVPYRLFPLGAFYYSQAKEKARCHHGAKSAKFTTRALN